MKAHLNGKKVEAPAEPKVIAVIQICGGIRYTVTQNQPFIKPTPEQIKNLHNLLNIDVILMEDEEKVTEETTEEGS